jgi:hypothetical protein
MTTPARTIDWRAASTIGGAALLGAVWAMWNLLRAGGDGAGGPRPALVWVVFSVPLCAFVGWVIARRQERWLAAGVCFMIYFFGIFAGARLELLAIGRDAADASFHALYFRLVLAVQTLACLLVAAQRATAPGGTIVSTTDS